MKGLASRAVVLLLLALVVFGVFVGLLSLYPGLREKIEDAIGLMGQQLGVEEEILHEGHALHVKLYPATPEEIWEFHLTNEPKHYSDSVPDSRYFTITDWYDRCVIFTTRVFNPDRSDQGFIYYVNPGATIQEGCGNLDECIENFIDEDAANCNSYRDDGCAPPEDYEDPKFGFCADCIIGCTASCDTSQLVKYQEFGTKMINKCNADENGGSCPLLKSGGEYTVEYGLICADDELWHACTENGQETEVLGVIYSCICSEEVEACWWESSVYEECSPGAVVEGECIVCQLDGISRKPDDTICENKYGTGYRCNVAGECVGPEAIPLSELVWMIGEGTCTAPPDWKMYILTNGTFITDFRENPCDNPKCMPDNKAILHNSTWIGIHNWRQDIAVQIEDPVMSALRRDRECLRGLVICDSCNAHIKTESKDGEVRLIERTCKSLTVDNFETIWVTTHCELMGPTQYWNIKSGDFIKIKKSDKIYIEKICEAGQILPETDCRVCNNQTVPFIENHTICQNKFGSDWYCLKGYCSGR